MPRPGPTTHPLPVPTAHDQAHRPSADQPHRAAVGPGVQGPAAPDLEKAALAQGLEPEPRAGTQRVSVLSGGNWQKVNLKAAELGPER